MKAHKTCPNPFAALAALAALAAPLAHQAAADPINARAARCANGAVTRDCGTGGGNADPSGKEAARQMETEAARIAQPLLATAPSASSLSVWCDQIVAFLDRWVKRANIQTQSSRFEVANQMLTRTLQASVQKIELDPSLASPLTLRLLKRGRDMAAMMDQLIPPPGAEGSAQAAQTVYNFQKDYIRLVVQESNRLDRELLIPYFYSFGACRDKCPEGFDPIQFETRYLEVARKQLEFPVKFFTNRKSRNGEVSYVSKGNERVFLILSRMIAEGVAEDIRQTLYAYSEACTVRDLEALAETLPDPSRVSVDYLDRGDEIDSVSRKLIALGNRLAAGECRVSAAK